MPENMSISVNGQSQVPPGFRFHPTEEELLHYYLKKKVLYEKIDLDVIRDVDLNKLEPWDIQERCKIGTTPQNDWYFFSHKDKKYPTGTRTNRATAAGFWKATGRDKVINSSGRRIGMRKTLVFYKGRAPHGQKSDWIMHEYRLDDNTSIDANVSNVMGDATGEEAWVVCRIFKKKNHHKTVGSPSHSSPITEETRTSHLFDSCNEGALDQIFQYMGRTSCKEETEANNNHNSPRFQRPFDTTINNNGCNYRDRFMKLPSLESPNSTTSQSCYQPIIPDNEGSTTNQVMSCTDPNWVYINSMEYSGLANWVALDRLVASQLNGQTETSRQLASFIDVPTMAGNDPFHLQLPTVRSLSPPPPPFSLPQSNNRSYHGSTHHHQDFNISDMDLWNVTSTRSSSTTSSDHPMCHVSNSSA